jgi:hypothetical protein
VKDSKQENTEMNNESCFGVRQEEEKGEKVIRTSEYDADSKGKEEKERNQFKDTDMANESLLKLRQEEEEDKANRKDEEEEEEKDDEQSKIDEEDGKLIFDDDDTESFFELRLEESDSDEVPVPCEKADANNLLAETLAEVKPDVVDGFQVRERHPHDEDMPEIGTGTIEDWSLVELGCQWLAARQPNNEERELDGAALRRQRARRKRCAFPPTIKRARRRRKVSKCCYGISGNQCCGANPLNFGEARAVRQ